MGKPHKKQGGDTEEKQNDFSCKRVKSALGGQNTEPKL
jgi:hypothetical protein